MAWWTKVVGAGTLDGIKKHDKKLGAIITLNFAVSFGANHADCGLYKREPQTHPDEPNLLPAMLAKIRQRQFAQDLRRVMGRKDRQ